MISISYLDKGLTIDHHGEKYEYLRPNGNLHQFQSISTGEILNYTESSFYDSIRTQEIVVVPSFSSQKELLVEQDTNIEIQDLNDLLSKDDIEQVFKRERYIKELRKRKISRGQINLIKSEIPDIAKIIQDDTPPAATTLAKWWQKYEKSNDNIISLVDKRNLALSRTRTSAAHDDFIRGIIDSDYMCETPDKISGLYITYDNTFDEFRRSRLALGFPPESKLSERTIYRRVENLNKYDVAVAHYGKSEANRQFKLIKGHLRAEFPLQYVEIDHTKLDLYIIDDRCNIPMGRPWLTIIKDRFSGVLLGLFVSYQSTGTDSIFSALRHSLEPHNRVHEIWPDIENIMPWGQGHIYVSDRGMDFMSYRYQLVIRQLLSDFEYCAVKSPWLKGSVERAFLTFNYLLETLPGKTFPPLNQPKDYNPEKDAVVRFSSFIYILYKWACDIYNVTPHSRKNARPLDLFDEGLINHPRRIPIIPEGMDVLFGIPTTSKLTTAGLQFQYLTYGNSQRLQEILNQFDSIFMTYRVNQTDLGYIMVLDPRDQTYFRVPCLDQRYAAGLSLVQHKMIKKVAKEHLKKHNVSEYLYKAKLHISNQIQEELSNRNNQAKKIFARYAGINSDLVLSGQEATLLSVTHKRSSDVFQNTLEAPAIHNQNIEIPDFGWLTQ